MKLNYEEDCKIDETALDVEWLEQTPLARRYIKNKLNWWKKLQQAHEELKTIRSELIHEVNEDPKGTVGKDKPNAGDIEAYYRRQERYKEAKQKWIDAEYEYQYASDMQMEISLGRKKSLEQLVELHGQNYFAGPRVPRNLTQEKENRQKRADAGVAGKMKRNRKEKE